MMDLMATVPYYTAYLSRALIHQGGSIQIGSISYYLDPACFSSRGLNVDPGLINIVGRFKLSRGPRRVLKVLEGVINLAALSVRFFFLPPAIVHVQYLSMLRWKAPLDLWVVGLCRWRGAKAILTVHDLLPHDTGDTHRRLYKRLYRSMDRLICHSTHVKARLISEFDVPGDKIAVIPHGPFFYDLPGKPPLQDLLSSERPDSLMVLWQGIIFPYKGVDLLLEAWQMVETHQLAVRLVIAGTGSSELLEQIRKQVSTLNLKRVELIFRFISADELVALYRTSSIVVYPYRAITTSGALATGLALGKTILASDLPVFRELLTDRENAWLVDPKDTKALSEALRGLIEAPSVRHQLAAAVSKMNFGDQSWLAIAKATEALYKQTISNKAI